MGLRKYKGKVEYTFNLEHDITISHWDTFCKFGAPYLNGLGFMPTVYAMGRQNETCYMVHDEIKGTSLQKFLTLDTSATNLLESYHTVNKLWPYLVYNQSKQFIDLQDLRVVFPSNVITDTIIDANGKLWYNKPYNLKLRRQNFEPMPFDLDGQYSLWYTLAGLIRFKEATGEVDNQWMRDKSKLIEENNRLKTDLKIRDYRDERLLQVDTVKATLGEDLYNLYFGDSDG